MENQYVRMAIATATVAVWAAIGFFFKLDANAYLVVGIPLVVIFQLAIARRPLTELWLRDPSPRRLPWWTIFIVLAFAVCPIAILVTTWKVAGWPERLWAMGAIIGAFPLGWAAANVRGLTLRCLLRCFLTAGVWGDRPFLWCLGA